MARSFNGTTDQISCGNTAFMNGLTAITVSAWINPSALSNAYSGIIWRDSGAAQTMQLMLKSSGKLAIYLTNTSYDGTGSHTLTTSTWAQVGFTYDPTNGLIGYVNGASDGSGAAGAGLGPPTTGTLFIATTSVASRFFAGSVADVAIWNTNLTASEMAALGGGFLPTLVRPNSVIAFYPIDGLQSPEPDLSGLANNGTLTGSAAAAGPPVSLFTPRWPLIVPLVTSPPLMGQIWI